LQKSLPLLCVFGVLQVLDVVTTNLVPDLESNPVVLFLFNHLGTFWWLPKAAISAAIAVGVMLAQHIPRRTLVTVTAGYAVVVSINVVNVVSTYLA
jgi:hypothetical protein